MKNNTKNVSIRDKKKVDLSKKFSFLFFLGFCLFVFSPIVCGMDDYYHPDKNYCGSAGIEVPRYHASGADFSPACYTHDKCYSECRTTHNSQEECDDWFNQDLDAACTNANENGDKRCEREFGKYNPLRYACYTTGEYMLLDCYITSDAYWAAVSALAGPLDAYPCEDGVFDPVDSGEGSIEDTGSQDPSPAHFTVKDTWSRPYTLMMNAAEFHLMLENTGDEGGDVRVKIEECTTKKVYYNDVLYVSGGSIYSQKHLLEDLKTSSSCHFNDCLKVTLKWSDGSYTDKYSVPVYSASISGRVFDAAGKPVKDAVVTADSNQSDTTGRTGRYELRSILLSGDRTITATHPNAGSGSAKVNVMVRDYGNRSCIGLDHSDVDIRLSQDPATFEITCPVDDYTYRMSSGDFTYTGASTGVMVSRSDIVPGNYTIIISKEGYTTTIKNIILPPSETTLLECGIKLFEAYTDDKAVEFTPNLNELWKIKLENLKVPYYAEISKDANTIFLVVSNPRVDGAEVLVYDSEGNKIGEIPLVDVGKGEIRVKVKSSYDGSHALVDCNNIYSREGTLIGRNTGTAPCNEGYVSLDGAFICNRNILFTNDFHPVPKHLFTPPYESSRKGAYCPSTVAFKFDGSMLGGCTRPIRDGGLCVYTPSGMNRIGDMDGDSVLSVDASADGKTQIVSSNQDKIFYFSNGMLVWSKDKEEIEAVISPQFGRVSISPGGGYAVVLDTHSSRYFSYIFDNEGNNLLDMNPQDAWRYHQFLDVEATGTGIYYVRYDGEIHFGKFSGKTGEGKTRADDSADTSTQGSGGDSKGVFERVIDWFKDFFN